MKSYEILGTIFILMSGFIYTIERGFSILSSSLVRAGFLSGRWGGEVPRVEISGFFTNVYVPLFLMVGLALVFYGFMKRDWLTGTFHTKITIPLEHSLKINKFRRRKQ
jgi:hypothetical protein